MGNVSSMYAAFQQFAEYNARWFQCLNLMVNESDEKVTQTIDLLKTATRKATIAAWLAMGSCKVRAREVDDNYCSNTHNEIVQDIYSIYNNYVENMRAKDNVDAISVIVWVANIRLLGYCYNWLYTTNYGGLNRKGMDMITEAYNIMHVIPGIKDMMNRSGMKWFNLVADNFQVIGETWPLQDEELAIMYLTRAEMDDDSYDKFTKEQVEILNNSISSTMGK